MESMATMNEGIVIQVILLLSCKVCSVWQSYLLIRPSGEQVVWIGALGNTCRFGGKPQQMNRHSSFAYTNEHIVLVCIPSSFTHHIQLLWKELCLLGIELCKPHLRTVGKNIFMLLILSCFSSTAVRYCGYIELEEGCEIFRYIDNLTYKICVFKAYLKATQVSKWFPVIVTNTGSSICPQ